ncbi:MAG: alanine racemase [Clostridia bacterium]|nr:alanine racemase [Clostridia bacterium]MDE7328515.1 alanine racemase [Clostridia bacterium]
MKRLLRTYCQIDLQALRSNIVKIKSLLSHSTKLAFVVKANAYSHGAVEVAKACEDLVDFFGVATAEEGAELRKNGLNLPILILGATLPNDFNLLTEYDLQATVYSLESAILLNSYCEQNFVKAKVHLAVDTGMGRIGFLPNEKDLALKAAALANLNIEGIFTHFACADSKDKTFTKLQTERFEDFIAYLKKSGVNIPLVHASNSAGVLDGGYSYGMVRCGLIAYGLYPSQEVEKKIELAPALSWHTLITHIKTLSKGSSVSYGATFVAEREVKVATLSVGYADGYPRILSGKASVLVKGKRAKIIGRICMDQMMIDVTDIDGVNVFDEVTLIGSQGEERISAEELADLANTINYEILCGILRSPLR